MIKFFQKERLDKDRRYCCSIDPSINDVGLAVWPIKDWKKLVMPILIADIKSTPSDDWTDKLDDICNSLNSVLAGLGIGMRGSGCTRIYCETPAFFNSSHGRQVAEKGDLVKLSASFGTIAALSWYFNCSLIPISVQEWKGQLDKKIVKERVLDLLPDIGKGCSSHIYDALGIGLYSKGLFQ